LHVYGSKFWKNISPEYDNVRYGLFQIIPDYRADVGCHLKILGYEVLCKEIDVSLIEIRRYCESRQQYPINKIRISNNANG
jgi:hypothetical protein